MRAHEMRSSYQRGNLGYLRKSGRIAHPIGPLVRILSSPDARCSGEDWNL